jgi:hypothetical protein
MIDVKDAVKIAATYLKELLPFANDIALEEVELSEDDRFWNITLSAFVPAPPPPKAAKAAQLGLGLSMSEFFREDAVRIYKILQIDAEAGTVRSMKIRKTQ